MTQGVTINGPTGGAPSRVGTRVMLGLALAGAILFLGVFALKYLTGDETVFGRFWTNRNWLRIHIAGGSVASSSARC